MASKKNDSDLFKKKKEDSTSSRRQDHPEGRPSLQSEANFPTFAAAMKEWDSNQSPSKRSLDEQCGLLQAPNNGVYRFPSENSVFYPGVYLDDKDHPPLSRSRANTNPDFADNQWYMTSARHPPHRGKISTFKCYGFKPQPVTRPSEYQQFGRGYCLVIAEFTDDLKGYAQDAKRIKEFFQNNLYYDVDLRYNLDQKNLLCELDDCVKKLKEAYYDRFFLFILSHGCDSGIYTCVKYPDPHNEYFDHELRNPEEEVNLEVPREDPQDPCLITTYESIAAFFKHTNIPEMSNYPKVLFFQTCRGDRLAKSAGPLPRSNLAILSVQKSEGLNVSPESERYSPSFNKKSCSEGNLCGRAPMKVTEGADIMVCYACSDGTKSWVPDTGSIFIEEALSVLQTCYKHEHLSDMMVEVNRRISRRNIGQSQCQMSEYHNRLTKKFFLQIPQKYIDVHAKKENDGMFHYHDEDP